MCQRMPNILNSYGLIQKMKIGFLFKKIQRIQTQKDSYIKSKIQVLRGYGEISVVYYRQVEASETGIDIIRCQVY